jgi:hypothetical protein
VYTTLTPRLRDWHGYNTVLATIQNLRLLRGNPDKEIFGAAWIPDPQFRASIERTLGKNFGWITRGKIRGLESIDWQAGITDLTGLENMVNLRQLNLDGATVSPSQWELVTPSSLPRLQTVALRYPPGGLGWSDMVALWGTLPHLSYLGIPGLHGVTSLSFLTTASPMVRLAIDGTGVSQLQVLQTLYGLGSFQTPNPDHEDWINSVELGDLGLDLSLGTANRAVIDDLAAKGVRVNYLRGNITSKVAVPTASITVDGSFADWATVIPALIDARGDGVEPGLTGLDVTRISIACTGSNVVVRIALCTIRPAREGPPWNRSPAVPSEERWAIWS